MAVLPQCPQADNNMCTCHIICGGKCGKDVGLIVLEYGVSKCVHLCNRVFYAVGY